MKLGLFMVQKSHPRAHVTVLSRGRCMCVCVGGKGGGGGAFERVACNSAVLSDVFGARACHMEKAG